MICKELKPNWNITIQKYIPGYTFGVIKTKAHTFKIHSECYEIQALDGRYFYYPIKTTEIITQWIGN